MFNLRITIRVITSEYAMKTLGILGGMSGESTIEYYRLLNEGVRRKLGGLNSPSLLISNINFDTITKHQKVGEWEECGRILGTLARNLSLGGADGFLISSNTMHKVAEQVSAQAQIPLLHICDALGRRLKANGMDRAGLLGTSFTMEDSFYRDHLIRHWGIHTEIPKADDRKELHRIIIEELCQGRIVTSSRVRGIEIIEELSKTGVQAVILGCTELGLLFRESKVSLPLIDTTVEHVEFALDWMMGVDETSPISGPSMVLR